MTALFASLIMVPFLRRWALDSGPLDAPDERKIHETPMPRLGGIAIFISFLFSTIIFVPINDTVRGLLAGALIIFATGVVDDLVGITSKRKFAGQIAACLTLVVIGRLYLTNLGDLFGFGPVILPDWLGIPFTVFALVGVINAINLIDGLDGLAGGVSCIALAAFFVLGIFEGDKITMLLSAALAGALLGFLKYNFYPARIFMGDTGSLVVGYLLGFLAIYTTQRANSAISPAVPVLILGLPLLDTVWVMTKRVRYGLSPFAADRTHVHHKFLSLGFEHRFTVIVIYTVSLFWASCALLLRHSPEYLLLLFYGVTAISSYLSLRYVLRNREKFPLLQKDASTGLRSSVTYHKICDLTDKFIPFIKFFMLGYLLLAAGSVISHNLVSWQVSLTLLLSGLFLWFRPFSKDRQFLMLLVYVTIGLASLEVWHSNIFLLGPLESKRAGDILLACASFLAFIKIQFRRDGELFLSTADYLVLAVCVFLAIASQNSAFALNLQGPLLRTVLAIIAVRTIVFRNPRSQGLAFYLMFAYLTLVTGATFF
jgi:UDP-GlcNAc:undecaprenyl-phosphate GlcNAc-1-phosphate transferase